MIYKVIPRPDKTVYICPAQNETASEDPISMRDQIIVEQSEVIEELYASLNHIVGTCKNFASNVSIGEQQQVLKKYKDRLPSWVNKK